jgi:hypothetical protein
MGSGLTRRFGERFLTGAIAESTTFNQRDFRNMRRFSSSAQKAYQALVLARRYREAKGMRRSRQPGLLAQNPRVEAPPCRLGASSPGETPDL